MIGSTPTPPRQARSQLPRGVKRQRKNGRDYYYHRKTWTRLPGEPWSPEMMAALEAIEAKTPLPEMPDTVAALAMSYLGSKPYLDLAPSSQAVRRRMVEGFARDFGSLPVSEQRGPTRKNIEQMLHGDEQCPGFLSHTPGWAWVWLSGFRALMAHAIKLGIRKTDPSQGIKRPKLKNPDGIATWTEEEIAAFRARWPLGTMERLALEMLLWTVQRRGDVVRFGRPHIKILPKPVTVGPFLITHAIGPFRQEKTGTVLTLPVFPELQAALDAMPLPTDLIPFLNRDGEAFEKLKFTCWFIRAARKAGLPPKRSPHGLRKAGCRRLAEAGCDAPIIAAWSGHRDWREIRRYTEAASQWRLALTGLERVGMAFGEGEQNGAETFFGNPSGNQVGKKG